MRSAKILSAVVLAGVLLGGPLASADEAFFMGLGDLPGGISQSFANGVSGDGSVGVGYSDNGASYEAFRWSIPGGMVGLGNLPAPGWSRAYAASFDGSVIVGTGGDPEREAFRWTEAGGVDYLAFLPGDTLSAAYGISNDGSVIVGDSGHIQPSSQVQAMRWSAGEGMVGLGHLPGSGIASIAFGVSDDGAVIVGESDSTPAAPDEEAFRWTAATGMVGLGDLPGGLFDSEASAISADGGTIVGGGHSTVSGTNWEAFRWTASEGMVGLEDLLGGSFASYASDVSGDGSVIVGWSNSNTDSAFIWQQHTGMRNLHDLLEVDLGLDLTDWFLEDARGVSADGLTIVGWGHNPDGDTEAWIAHIPEPATLWMLAVCGLVVTRRGRRVCVRQIPARVRVAG